MTFEVDEKEKNIYQVSMLRMTQYFSNYRVKVVEVQSTSVP